MDDIYVPLTLVKDNYNRDLIEEVLIDKYPVGLVNEYNKILITDTAGMGKSTLTKYIFLDTIKNNYGIPIYIELRKLKSYWSIKQQILHQLKMSTKSFDETMLMNLFKDGGFIFFLDGYDEISLSERSKVTSDIQDFVSKLGNNIFIMTSRPEQALASFGMFQQFKIKPLSKEESYTLLKNYDNKGPVSRKLVELLQTEEYSIIDDFLENPLLVSLLFSAFDYKNTIPLKKNVFYRQVYDAYFDSFDLTKGDSFIHEKYSSLGIDDFERVLRYIGYKCLQSHTIEYNKDDLLKIISDAKSFCSDLNFDQSGFLKDIKTTVPLFVEESGSQYRWVHKSLQEYFAAQFIYKDAKGIQDQILTALYKSQNIDEYIYLLDLYCDIDPIGFRNIIVFLLCKEYVEFYDMQMQMYNGNAEKEVIEDRIGFMFLKEICLVKYSRTDTDVDVFKYVKNCTKGHRLYEVEKVEELSVYVESKDKRRYDRLKYYYSIGYSPYCNLVLMIEKKRPDIFRNTGYYKYTHGVHMENYQYEAKVIANPMEFDGLNALLHFAGFTCGKVLDYNKCKKEFLEIQKTMNGDDKPKLLAGL